MNSSKPSKTPITSYMMSDVPVIADSLVWEADDKVRIYIYFLINYLASMAVLPKKNAFSEGTLVCFYWFYFIGFLWFIEFDF